MHCLHFICERKFYACTHVKITRHWNSTLRDSKREVVAASIISRASRGPLFAGYRLRYTVELLCNGHLGGQKKVAVAKRWPLQRGFKQDSMYMDFFVRRDKKKWPLLRELMLCEGSTVHQQTLTQAIKTLTLLFI